MSSSPCKINLQHRYNLSSTSGVKEFKAVIRDQSSCVGCWCCCLSCRRPRHGLGFVICNENKIILKIMIGFRTNLKLTQQKIWVLSIAKFKSWFLEDLLCFLLRQKAIIIRRQPHSKLRRRLRNPSHQAICTLAQSRIGRGGRGVPSRNTCKASIAGFLS